MSGRPALGLDIEGGRIEAAIALFKVLTRIVLLSKALVSELTCF